MNKKRIFTSMIFAAVMAVIMPYQMLTALAANGRISFSDPSVSVGEEVSVNMKVTVDEGALNSADVMLSYDASVLEFLSGENASGGAGSVRVKVGAETTDAQTLTSTLKFRALKSGTAKITVGSQEIYDAGSQLVTIDRKGDSTVTVAAAANASNDARLSDLKISPGTLTPDFSPDVDSYTAMVGLDIDKITVSAASIGEGASVSVVGNEGLQLGENQVICTVTAEDGQTTATYTIVVTQTEDAESGESVPVSTLKVETAAHSVTIIPLEDGVELPAGLAECEILIDGEKAQGWVWETETDHKYCIFYGENKSGEKDFYRYDLVDKTMQRYFQDPAKASEISREQYVAVAEDYNALMESYTIRLWIIIALGIICAVLLIIVIVLLVGRKHASYDEEMDVFKEDREPLRVREKTNRSISKEERYMRGLELEEEKMNLATSEVEEVIEPDKESEEDMLDDRDDDFEFIDLDI